MKDSNQEKRRPSVTRAVVLLALVVSVCACATTQSTRTPTRVEIQEAVGFTITEEARVGSGVRLDYAEALNLFEQGNLEQSIRILEAVVATAPDLSAPRIDLGIAWHRAGDLAAAESSLLQALALSPNHPVAHNELGIVYRKTGRFNKARQSYEAALAIYPGYHFARRNLAVLCDLYLVDLTCALQNYEAYMETVASDDEASIWVSDIRNRIAREE